MLKKTYSLVIVFGIIAIASNLRAQNPNILWMELYGGGQFDCAYWVEQLGEGDNLGEPGFIIVGFTETTGERQEDVYLIKTDSYGISEWARTYGSSDCDVGFCVKPTDDGGFIVCGFTRDGSGYTSNGYIIKTDALGDTVWTGTYGGPSSESFVEITPTSDGGYIAAGFKIEPDGYYTDVYAVKIDSAGAVIWSREYGRPLFEDHAKSVLQTSDGGYIICGVTSGIETDSDIWLIKTDPGGNVEWTRTYGGDGTDAGYSVDQTSDGGYIVAGYKTILIAPYHHDMYLVKTTSNGTVQWERTYGGSGFDRANSVRETSDGGFIAAGLMGTPAPGGCDIYVVKTDGNGDMQWSGTMGDCNVDVGYCVRQTDDGNFVIAGSTISFGGAIRDAFLMKISPGHVGIEDDMSEFTPHTFIMQQNYPNPFNSTTTISYALPEPSKVVINIYDLLGREVESFYQGHKPAGNYTITWDADKYTSGIYIYKIEAGGYSKIRRMLYLK